MAIQYCFCIIDQRTKEISHVMTSSDPIDRSNPFVQMVDPNGKLVAKGDYARHYFEIESDDDEFVRAKSLREILVVDSSKIPQIGKSFNGKLRQSRIIRRDSIKDESEIQAEAKIFKHNKGGIK